MHKSFTIFLPAGGYRNSGGLLDGQGFRGDYWSSTPINASTINALYFTSTQSRTNNNPLKADGWSARCVR